MIIYIDIDEIIIKRNFTFDNEIINKINNLYKDGNEIHFWTNNENLFEIYNILKDLNCNFNSVKLNKPNCDLFIGKYNVSNFF